MTWTAITPSTSSLLSTVSNSCKQEPALCSTALPHAAHRYVNLAAATQQPEALSLVFVDFDDTIKVALKLKLTAKNWLQARSDDGYIGRKC